MQHQHRRATLLLMFQLWRIQRRLDVTAGAVQVITTTTGAIGWPNNAFASIRRQSGCAALRPILPPETQAPTGHRPPAVRAEPLLPATCPRLPSPRLNVMSRSPPILPPLLPIQRAIHHPTTKPSPSRLPSPRRSESSRRHPRRGLPNRLPTPRACAAHR
jgi:hypothetical protein